MKELYYSSFEVCEEIFACILEVYLYLTRILNKCMHFNDYSPPHNQRNKQIFKDFKNSFCFKIKNTNCSNFLVYIWKLKDYLNLLIIKSTSFWFRKKKNPSRNNFPHTALEPLVLRTVVLPRGHFKILILSCHSFYWPRQSSSSPLMLCIWHAVYHTVCHPITLTEQPSTVSLYTVHASRTFL